MTGALIGAGLRRGAGFGGDCLVSVEGRRFTTFFLIGLLVGKSPPS